MFAGRSARDSQPFGKEGKTVTIEKNTRELDKEIVRDFSSRMSYASYLQLPTL